MAETIKDFKIPYPVEGVIRSAQLDDNVCPEDSVELAVNMNFDRVGAVTTRPGVATYALARDGEIVSFGTLAIQGGVKRLFSQVGTDISVYASGSWSSVRTCTVSTKARFSQWLNRLYMVNGTDALQCSSGGAFSAEAGFVPATTMPVGNFIQAGFDGRIWIASQPNDALYYSDIVQFTPPSTYSITYTATNFIKNLSPQDGESFTGLFRVPRALLVFKQNHIYRVYSATNVDPYPAYNVGTYSQESIVQAKDGVYFHHSSGFYKFAYDSQPTEISRRVIDFVKAIPRSSYESIVGVYDGYDAVKWSVGTITVDGVTYQNCQMRYSISTQVWTIYDFAGNEITALIRFDDGTTIEQVAGFADGKVGKLDSGNTDFGAKFYYEMIDRERSFTELSCYSKNVTGFAVIAENGGGAEIEYQKDGFITNCWGELGTLEDKLVTIFPNVETEDFNEITFRVKGYSSGTPMVFKGIELLTVQSKGLDKN